MRKALMALMFVLFALPAFAQSKVTFAESAYLTAAAIDWSSTVHSLHQNQNPDNPYWYREGNPMFSGLSEHPALLFVAGQASDVGIVFVAHKIYAKKHPVLLSTGLYIASALRVGFAVKNLRQANVSLTLYQHSF